MHTPTNNNNNQNSKSASTTQATNGGATTGGIDDEGGGEEPANPADKPQSKATLNNNIVTNSTNGNNATLVMPASPSVGLKSPKSPRPLITLEITPATPNMTFTGSTLNSVPPSAVSQAKSSPAVPPSKKANNRGPTSPHEAVQSWVQSQATSPVSSSNPNAPAPTPITATTPAPAAPTPTKRYSFPSSDARARRPSVSSQKSVGLDAPRPPSVAGSVSGGEERGKFSLRDLLSSGPKLSRRNSASSKKSVSSGGGAGPAKSKSGSRAGSQSGESALESKYGIYGKMAVGKGATSVVRLAHKWDRTEEKLYAVKEFRPRRNKESERDYVKKLTSEFCIASALRQPNIVETVDLMQDNEGKWCVVMEFCPGGDLYNAIRKGGMSPAEVECSFKQILTGVGYLHAQGVAHRDLKPENIFFDGKGQIKIGDFGASTVFRLPWEQTIHKSGGLCGSEPYIAPEQFAQPVSYDARLVDVWACGIVYYCLHFSELPWSCAQPSDKTYAQYAQQCASPALSIAGIPFLKPTTTMAISGANTPITPGPGTPIRQDSAGLTPTMANLGMTSATPSGLTPSGLGPGSPFGPSSGPTTPSVLGSPSGPLSPSALGKSRAEREKEHQREQAAAYPSTIHHLSPRVGRPVLRRMLEPKPEHRATIEEVLRHPWVQSIEVCTLPGVVPKHIHPAAIAAAAAGGIVGDKYDK